ncbi:MAG: RnfABCDGE type electron transport complex subunit G [Prevotella sp.]|nr:RnfABCDGE type electron transport complex subunit G [Prevotella sp.]
MKKLESSLLNMVLVLVGVALIMGGLLALVNHATHETIDQQAEKALADGIKKVMGTDKLQVTAKDTVSVTDKKGKTIDYIINKVADEKGADLGAAVESTTMGFGGELKVLVGFNPEGDILGYTLLAHAETPGLGAKADTWFQKGQKGDIIGRNPGKAKDPKKGLQVTKDDGGEVEAITASTITSRAFLNAINEAYDVYLNKNTDANTGATKVANN